MSAVEAVAKPQLSLWGTPRKIRRGVWAASNPFTLCKTKICDFPCPMYDPTKKIGLPIYDRTVALNISRRPLLLIIITSKGTGLLT